MAGKTPAYGRFDRNGDVSSQKETGGARRRRLIGRLGEVREGRSRGGGGLGGNVAGEVAPSQDAEGSRTRLRAWLFTQRVPGPRGDAGSRTAAGSNPGRGACSRSARGRFRRLRPIPVVAGNPPGARACRAATANWIVVDSCVTDQLVLSSDVF